MNARTSVTIGALALALVLGFAARTEAGDIVYWGGTHVSTTTRVIRTATPVVTTRAPARVISTTTPVVTTAAAPVVVGDAETARVAGEAYREGYEDGYEDGVEDGVRTGAAQRVVTRTVGVPTYTLPSVILRSHPHVYRSILRHPTVRVLRPSRHRCPVLQYRHSTHRGHRSTHRGHRSTHHGHRSRPGGLVIRW